MTSHSYKLTCKSCNRYEIVERLPTINEWRCTLCSTKDGVVRVQQFTKCGTCSQVYSSKENCPNCETFPKTKEYRIGKLGNWGAEPVVKENVKDAVEKGERILKNRVRNELEERTRRDKNIEKLLIEQNKLLKKLVNKK